MDKYINRNAEKQINKLANQFPVVMITGPRQVGKTTLLRNILQNKDINFVTLDNIKVREMAIRDPELFLETYGAPLVIDEFQYAPNLLSYIKINIDNARFENLKTGKECNGMYFLTGSQVFKTMNNISESLAGRVGILDLYGLSNSELNNNYSDIFIPDIDLIKSRKKNKKEDVSNLYKKIFIGSYPDLWKNPDVELESYFDGYVRTYIERDIRELINVKDELKFMNFITSVAVRTAQELNYSSICEDANITSATAKEWMGILVNTGIVYLLQPFSTKTTNRLIKRPKIYFMDTGLACYLAGYKDAKTLENSAFNGSIFETYVITEIIKAYTNNGYNANRYLSYYRDKQQKEIDLIIEYNNKIYPVEIKKSKSPNINFIKNFTVLNRLDNVQKGTVLCMIDEIFPIDKNNYCVPIEYI